MGQSDRVLLRYRGRDVRAEDLATIRAQIAQAATAQGAARGRSAIARRLCEGWDWRQANGALKEYAARDLLLRLEEAGHIQLPPRLREKNNHAVPDYRQRPLFEERPLAGRVDTYGALEIRAAEGPERYLWDYLVHHHHYLGRPKLVGAYLKQLVWLDGQVVACLGWASAAWKVDCRDRWIGWTPELRRQRLVGVVNNVRFLILPWVRVEHLASKVLGQSLRGLAAAWQARVGQRIVLAETFVDPARFAGTCYRAANWQCLGQTRGHAKRGNAYRAHAVSKDVWVRPLTRRWRPALLEP
ncbi:Druantia anti-phage system protein DruA [Thioalkalivibrio nitratireducens]|uniref:Druantia anti-phage system protein DruA n=1 Tax=Thioalkalivibrio nitratireducens TaxID=186931 RepID=UPI0005C17B94|nr:Druantia anti-phage system protein DruA [Thioalkalivibrio nitratireducens]